MRYRFSLQIVCVCHMQLSQHQTVVLHGVAACFSFTLICNAMNHWLLCCFLSTPMLLFIEGNG